MGAKVNEKSDLGSCRLADEKEVGPGLAALRVAG